ncbi:hypothetical protein VTN77DRAFT_4257 [Rasamsonia byssochlamydoides]|uniref:uncharacterized protein n=1 Tax=Rasamsonia byssochlamydoides TaxID=89139 RepID=UPI0037446757
MPAEDYSSIEGREASRRKDNNNNAYQICRKFAKFDRQHLWLSAKKSVVLVGGLQGRWRDSAGARSGHASAILISSPVRADCYVGVQSQRTGRPGADTPRNWPLSDFSTLQKGAAALKGR